MIGIDFFFVHNLSLSTDTAITSIYTLSLHDALPISADAHGVEAGLLFSGKIAGQGWRGPDADGGGDRKSTRLNSSHVRSSYAVFCLKKKNKKSAGGAI